MAHGIYIYVMNDVQYDPVHSELFRGFEDATHVFDIGSCSFDTSRFAC